MGIGCGHCTLKPKAIESFCCHDKAWEYDEYDTLLKEAEPQGGKCLTAHEEFKANMLPEGFLKIDVCLITKQLGDRNSSKPIPVG